MGKINKLIFLLAVGLTIISGTLIGCKQDKVLEDDDKNNKISLNLGTINENNNGNYSNYDLKKDTYKKIDSDIIIAQYDYESNNCIGLKNNQYIGIYNGKEVKLKNLKPNDIKYMISPGGEYLGYFSNNNDIKKFRVINLKDGTEKKINIQVSISGILLDWVSSKEVVYYGIDIDSGKNGVYLYNIEQEKEELLEEFESGFVRFLKCSENGIIYLQETLENSKLLKEYNVKTKKSNIICSEDILVSDIIKTNDNYYLLGNVDSEHGSIYKLKDLNTSKLVYDFPSKVYSNKGLSTDEEGNVLFIGSNSDNSESIYKIDSNDYVSILSDGFQDCNFVNMYINE